MVATRPLRSAKGSAAPWRLGGGKGMGKPRTYIYPLSLGMSLCCGRTRGRINLRPDIW